MMINIEKLEALEDYLKSNRDYYKPTVTDRGFAGEVNNYIKYKSEGDKDKKLSLEKRNIYSKVKQYKFIWAVIQKM